MHPTGLGLNLPATVTFQYEFNGNLTNDGRRVFEYDYENQLTNVYVASAWRSEFRYDALGRRRVRKEYTWNSGLGTWNLTNEVRYVYDGMLVTQERDGNNLTLVTYTRGNDLSGTLPGAGGIGGLLARTANSQLLSPNSSTAHAYYHSDGNGNVTALVDTNGFIVARYQYDPYGNLLGMSGPLADANSYRFSSKEWCANSGLYYYGFRYYEPNLQRWLNRDPMTSFENPLDGDFDKHVYDFVENAPTRFVDPDGLWKWYGNWGGPNWTAGCKGTWEQVVDQKMDQKEAIDSQDKCYEMHDKCHAACRDEFRAAPPEKWQSAKLQLGKCLRKCDWDLSKCLKNLPKADPANNCHSKIGGAVFCVLGAVGHAFESDPPPRSKCNGN